MNTRNLIIDSVNKELDARIAKQKAIISNYLENPAGVPEHHDITAEVLNALSKLESASSMKGQFDRLMSNLDVNDMEALKS